MKHEKKILRSFKTKNEAVAGIVVAVMIVGLVLAVVSIIQTVYIPKWMETREAEHMGVVSDQFSQLKFAIDSQIVLQKDSPISSSITLGSRELGFFISNKAFGRLGIITNGWAYRVITTIGNTFEDNLGVLRYNSENAYFLNQVYTYETGGLVLDQTQGYVYIIKPDFTAYYNTSVRQITLSLRCVDLVPSDERTSITGYGTYPIRTEYLMSTNTSINLVQSLAIITSYPTIWYNLFNTTLSNAHLVKNTDYTITKTQNQVTISFNYPPINNVILNLEKCSISTQITLGWSD